MRKSFILLTVFLLIKFSSHAQFLMDMLDTTKEEGKGLLNIYKKFDHLRIGGYIQPQFQAAPEGAKNYEGGDFAAHVDNRFMLRRSRIRIDYAHLNDPNGPGVQIVFQFDANERSFTVRDVWGRIFENRYKLFSFTIGMFARPFGYEVNLSSSDRETPERGRMSQILMKSERDLGAMISFDPRREKFLFKNIKIDLGVFNGQGITTTGDYDSKKDIIGRIALKPIKLNPQLSLSAGASVLAGGLFQSTKYVYRTGIVNGVKQVLVDSSANNTGSISPRNYAGIDAQLKIKNAKGFTEFRAEYITGTQTGTASSSETPTALVSGKDGFYRRHFNGGYFYFLQHLFSTKHQLVIKYDWYDPNTRVSGKQIGTAGANFTTADIKFRTLNIGYNYMATSFAKLSLFYALVHNESTSLTGYTADVKDNVFTARLQFRF